MHVLARIKWAETKDSHASTENGMRGLVRFDGTEAVGCTIEFDPTKKPKAGKSQETDIRVPDLSKLDHPIKAGVWVELLNHDETIGEGPITLVQQS